MLNPAMCSWLRGNLYIDATTEQVARRVVRMRRERMGGLPLASEAEHEKSQRFYAYRAACRNRYHRDPGSHLIPSLRAGEERREKGGLS